MRKKLFLAILSILLLLSVNVSAKEPAAVSLYDDSDYMYIKVDGEADCGTSVLVMLLQRDKRLIDLSYDSSCILNLDRIVVGENKSFSTEFLMDVTDDKRYDGGSYCVVVNYVENGKAKQKEITDIKFVKKSVRDEVSLLIQQIKTSDDIYNIVYNHSDDLMLDSQCVTSYLNDASVFQAVNSGIFALKSGIQGAGDFKNIFERCAAFYMINSADENRIVDLLGKYQYLFLYDMTAFDIDANNKTEIYTRISEKSFVDEAEMIKYVNEIPYVILAQNAQRWGLLEGILTDTYKKIFNLNTDELSQISDASRVYVKMLDSVPFESIEDINNKYLLAIQNVVEEENEKENSYGGGSRGGGSGGGVIPVVVPEPQKENTEVNKAAEFVDIDNCEWAREAIEYLYSKNIINGKSDTEFMPDDNVTRAEFVKMVIGAFYDADETARCNFSDVNKNNWSYKYIATAFEKGIVNGIGENTFKPDNNIIRQDMATILYKCVYAGQISGDGVITFKDTDKISDYAIDAVKKLSREKIINGFEDNTFAPQKNATRAEAAKMIYNLLMRLQEGV